MKRWTYRLNLTDPMTEEPLVIGNAHAHYLRKSSAKAHALMAIGSLMEVGYSGTWEIVPITHGKGR